MRFMKRSILLVASYCALLFAPICLVGCGGEEPTSEKLEESRQQLIDRSERMRQDINKK
jgi:hypothetical protein